MGQDAEVPHAPQTFGERIAHARRQLGSFEGKDVLPPQLAERVGVSAASAYAWEADASVPSERNLMRLADVLRVSPAWLRYGVTPEQPTSGTLTEEEIAAAIARSEARRRAEGRPTVAEEEAAKKKAREKPLRAAGGSRRPPKRPTDER